MSTALVLVYQGQTSFTTSGSSSHTFTAAVIGSVDTRRVVIVAVSAAKDTGSWSANPVSSMTLAGSGMTLAGSQILDPAISMVVAIYYLAVPSGATADIIVNLAAAAHPITIDVWAMVGQLSNTPSSTASNSATGTSISASLTILDGGIGIGVSGGNIASQSLTWTNMTLGAASANANGSAASSYSTTVGAASRTVNATGSVPLGLTLAAWQ
jgi:hypothetical protein